VAAELLVAAEPGGRPLGTVTWCPPESGLRELATGLNQGAFRMLAVTPPARDRRLRNPTRHGQDGGFILPQTAQG
jgi:hypothetical protein